MSAFFERIVQSDPELIRMGGSDLKAIILKILDLDERVCNSSKEMAQKWGRPLERCMSEREVETMSQEEKNEWKTLGDRVDVDRQKLIEEFYECVARGEQRLRELPSETKENEILPGLHLNRKTGKIHGNLEKILQAEGLPFTDENRDALIKDLMDLSEKHFGPTTVDLFYDSKSTVSRALKTVP